MGTRRHGGDRRGHAAVLVKPLGGSWQQVGVMAGRGQVPAELSLSADEGGPAGGSFALGRDASVEWPDLGAGVEVNVEIAGARVWGGRVATPPADEARVGVSLQGWQYHMDDDATTRLYVRSTMGDYVDARGLVATDLGAHRALPVLEVDGGRINAQWPPNYSVLSNEFITATFDAGASVIKRAVVNWTRITGTSDPDDTTYSRLSDQENPSAGPADDASQAHTSTGSVLAHTASVARRYHHIILFRNGAGGTWGNTNQGHIINSSRLFGDASFESGNASALTLAKLAKDVRAQMLPFASTDETRIDPTGASASLNIPDLHLEDAAPRAYLDAGNTYFGWRIGIDAWRRVFVLPPATTPLYAIGAWPGSRVESLAPSSLDELYNKVIVNGQDEAGKRLRVVRTRYCRLLNDRGLTRTAVISVDSSSTTAGLEFIGDAWLSENSRVASRGSAVVGVNGARAIGGGAVHPSTLLLAGGERIRLMQYMDPERLSLGRDVKITSIDYDHDREEARISLDREKRRLDAWLARLAVITDQGLQSVAS